MPLAHVSSLCEAETLKASVGFYHFVDLNTSFCKLVLVYWNYFVSILMSSPVFNGSVYFFIPVQSALFLYARAHTHTHTLCILSPFF